MFGRSVSGVPIRGKSMKLGDYIASRGLTLRRAASQLTTPAAKFDAAMLSRYINDKAWPDRARVDRIYEWSGGNVTASDLAGHVPVEVAAE